MVTKPMDPDELAHWELRRLAKVQQKLLPQSAPEMAEYAATLMYRPAYVVTGDYYDFFPLTQDAWGVFIGDGSGHGPAACMIMAMMRTILRTHPDIHKEPGATLEIAGAMLRELIPSDMFMTGLYLRLEKNGRVQWAAAGQHPPIRLKPCGTIPPSDLDAGDVPLGLHSDHGIRYETMTWELDPGERLLLFTDGLYEAQDHHNQKFGRERIEASLRESLGHDLPALTDCLSRGVDEHLAETEYDDDFTVIAIERRLG